LRKGTKHGKHEHKNFGFIFPQNPFNSKKLFQFFDKSFESFFNNFFNTLVRKETPNGILAFL
jgi:hypothetical protein